MNRMARIVPDPNRTYAGTRTAVQLCGSQHVYTPERNVLQSILIEHVQRTLRAK